MFSAFLESAPVVRISFARHSNTPRRIRVLLISMLASLIAGCALLVPHRPPEKLTADDPVVLACATAVGADPESIAPAPRKISNETAAERETRLAAEKKAREDEVKASIDRAMRSPGGVDGKRLGTQICSGIERAQGYHDAYLTAARWNVGFRNTAAALAIPLAGLVVREGLDSTPSHAKIADFSVATVILYGWSTQLTSRPREKVYFNGMQAMSCAIVEAQPVVVGVGQLQALGTKSEEVTAARRALEKALAAAGLSQLKRPEDQVYLKAFADADNALARASDFAVQLAKTAGEFLPLVEILAAEIDKNIADTEPSEQSLMTLVNGFGAQAQALAKAVPAPTTTVATAQGGTEQGLRAEQLERDQVVPRLVDLLNKTRELNDLLAKVISVASVTSNVRSCKPAGVANDFKVEPNQATAVVEEEKTVTFTITNSISVPSVHVEGEKADAIQAGDITVKGDKFVVVVTGKAATGDAGPTLVITDGTGSQQKRITINVSAKKPGDKAPASNNSNTNSNTNSQPGTTAEAALREPQESAALVNAALVPDNPDEKVVVKKTVELLQCVVGAKVDGTVGAETRAAILKFRKSEPAKDKDGIDGPLLTEVKQALEGNRKECKTQP